MSLKKNTHNFFLKKSHYNRPGEYIDLIQLPSYNHVHYTIIYFNELDIGVIATRHYQTLIKE